MQQNHYILKRESVKASQFFESRKSKRVSQQAIWHFIATIGPRKLTFLADGKEAFAAKTFLRTKK